MRQHTRTVGALIAGALLLVAGAATTADDRYGNPGLERSAWWPYADGPRYGEVPDSLRHHPRVVRLQAGSFDTRGSGWRIPPALRLGDAASRKPGAAWLVQLEGPITEAKKDVLRLAGATIYRFHPVNTFLVRAEDPARLAGLPGVLWAGPYHPAYRLEPALGQAPTRDPIKAKNERISVRVRLFEAADKPAVLQRLTDLGAALDLAATHDPHDLPNRVYFTATPQTILAAAKMNEVFWVEEVSREGFALNAETQVVVQSGSINNGRIFWDAGVDGSSQIIAVADSGLDVDTELMSHTATDAGTPGPSHRKVHLYSSWADPPNFATCAGTSGYSHGTNSTQSAAGNRSGLGLNGNLDGVAKDARVIFQDVGPNDLICCLIGCLDVPNPMFGMWDEVRANGGRTFNGSWVTCSYGTYGTGASDLDQYAWDHKDWLGFFSGGNGGGGNACPGTNKNNISSGGHFQEPFQNEHYGSRGPSPDNRMGPTVLAPACDHAGGNPAPFDFATSTSVQSDDNDITGPPMGDAGINEGSCGTSFSSPYLLGTAALVADYFEKGYYPSGVANAADGFTPTGALLKAALINSGDYFVHDCETQAPPNDCPTLGIFTGLMGSMGMGRVNLSNTLALAGQPQTPQGIRVVDRGASDGLATGEFFEETIEVVDDTVELRVALVWVDRTGSTLTNDLRLVVTGPNGGPGETYFGNNFPASGPYSLSEAAGGLTDDNTNVTESVRIDPAELVAGTWTVRVEGTNVPMGDPNFNNTQPFALIAAGGFDSLGIPEVSPAGSAEPLRVTAVGAGDVTWIWENITDPGTTYSFYRGTLAGVRAGAYDHGMIGAGQCDVAANTLSLSDLLDGNDSYYLVAARESGQDGPLGSDGDDNPRPPASPACP